MARYGRNGQRLVEPHEKSMCRYGAEAGGTGSELASWVLARYSERGIDTEGLQKIFGGYPPESIARFATARADQFGQFLSAAPSRRQAALKRLMSEDPPIEQQLEPVVLVLAVCFCEKASALFDVRDDYRESLAPGEGYRKSLGGMVAFAGDVARLMRTFDFPEQVFLDAERYGQRFGF